MTALLLGPRRPCGTARSCTPTSVSWSWSSGRPLRAHPQGVRLFGDNSGSAMPNSVGSLASGHRPTLRASSSSRCFALQ
eukprot:5630854-Pyramimonas_sp.AAC.1